MLGLTAATMAQNVPSYVPTNGLEAWYSFNGNANDESGNGNNGTVNGVINTTDRNGINNSAFYFNGNSNIIVNNQFFNNGWTSYTINLWVDLAAVNWTNTFLNTSPHCGVVIGYSYLGTNKFYHFKGADPINNSVPCWTIFSNDFFNYNQSILNQWLMISITKLNNNYTYYVNGQLDKMPIPNNSPLNGFCSMYFGSVESGSEFMTGKLDDIGIWNRALTQQEITNLYNGVNCANNTTITPSTNTLNTGSTAIFSASTSDSNPSHVWQSDFGQGYVTLNNFGNYSGTNTATLNLSNVQLSNHNLPIRVITTSGNCIDTSNVAVISIVDTCINTITDTTLITVTDTLLINTNLTGVNPPNNVNTIKIFPNPANDHITINYGNFSVMNGYQLKIENSLGQQVFQTNITQQSDYLNLTTWGGNGLYFVHIINPQGNTIDIRKIVLQ